MDYLDQIGRQHIAQHDQELGAYALAKLAQLKGGIRLFGPHIGRAGLVSFLLKDIHAHDVVTVADQRGVALRGGHHCNQPLMRKLGVESTARASFYFYNTTEEIDRFVEVLGEPVARNDDKAHELVDLIYESPRSILRLRFSEGKMFDVFMDSPPSNVSGR